MDVWNIGGNKVKVTEMMTPLLTATPLMVTSSQIGVFDDDDDDYAHIPPFVIDFTVLSA